MELGGQDLKKTSSDITGGDKRLEIVYSNYKKQSTTHNATGVYDMNGGLTEIVASYIDDIRNDFKLYGGTNEGDLCGATDEERTTSTAFKTVYSSTSKAYQTKLFAGDSLYETSFTNIDSGKLSWFNDWTYYPWI